MKIKRIIRAMKIAAAACIIILCTGCGIAKSSFNSGKKFSPQQLERDYGIFRDILEESHPSIYWYTPKDTMDRYFNWGENKIKDSLTEPEFKKILSYVLAKINCGHTTSHLSKHFSKWQDTVKDFKFFPLSLKLWDDTTVVAANLNRRDNVLKRGTIVTAINNKSLASITDTMFKFISSDGYNLTHKYQILSNRGGFGSLYSSIYGLKENYKIDYIDSIGKRGSVTIPVYDPMKDTANRRAIRNFIRPTKKERKRTALQTTRSLRIDTANKVAFLDVNSFGRGYHLKRFFRKSFHHIRKYKIDQLVIDVRSNGGGSPTNSTLLSQYLINKKFRIADSLYATSRKNRHHQYIKKYFFTRLFMLVFTKKKKDGHYHFGYFERHYFKPKKKNHFDGQAYVIIGGNSFSATALFTSSIINQENILVVGEETGGGSYGNSGWYIPDVKLPETKVEFRLPLFRLVIDKDIPKNGRGILPEFEAKPTVDAIRKNQDYKLDKVIQLIRERRGAE